MSEPTNTHVVRGMSNAAYHAKSAISKSGLDLIHRAPALFKHRRENPIQPTPAMRMGTLVHTAVLEPHLMADACVIMPEDAPRRPTSRQREAKKQSDETIAAIKWWDAFDELAQGKELISAEERDRLNAISAAVHAHESAGDALAMLQSVEESIFWTHLVTGVDCRCRPDGILSNGTIIDIKTTRSAEHEDFSRSIAKYRYHVQAAYYYDGYAAVYGKPPTAFMFIAVETEPPHLVACYVASAAMIARGRADYQTDLHTYAWCMERGEWPGLAPQPVYIDLPRWA